jgi:glutamyl-tRNA synthetase
VKLEDISKEIISQMKAEEIYNHSLTWAKKHNNDLAKRLEQNPQYAQAIFNIERKDALKPRKDLACWANLEAEISYFYDDLFTVDKEALADVLAELKDKEIDVNKLINDFISSYNPNDDQVAWFDKLKEVAKNHGFAASMKEYKAEPDKYKGQVGTIAQILRLLLTGRSQSPNLADVMKVLGKEKAIERLRKIT